MEIPKYSEKQGIIDITAPKFLWKYQKIDDYSLENLRNRKMWASEPEVFNDPFEFTFHSSGDGEFKELFDKAKKSKVVCLTDNPKNILMWSHYGNFHKGMCLGFENRTHTIPINYSDDFPIIDFTDKDEQQKILEFAKIMTTKSSQWSYERERRMIFIPEIDNKVEYPGELKFVNFGIKTSVEDIEKVKKAINDETVVYLKSTYNPKEYKLDWVELVE
ncbi:MAG: DUF2971 domain-containing protein [Allomuricauda sp.]